MDRKNNIYRIGREMAGMTQARWAEAIGVSTEAVGQYESGVIVPSDEVAIRMAEVSMHPVLGYWHLLNRSRMAPKHLPEVPCVPVAQAVCSLIAELNSFRDRYALDDLVSLAADGKIDPGEQESFNAILDQLGGIIRAALTVRYATSGGTEDAS